MRNINEHSALQCDPSPRESIKGPGFAAQIPDLTKGLHLLRAQSAADLGAALSFALANLRATQSKGFVSVISQRYVSNEAGVVSATGINELGINPSNVLFIHADTIQNALWSCEECLKSKAISCIILEIHTLKGLELTPTRRLALRTSKYNKPVHIIDAMSPSYPTASMSHWTIKSAQSENASRASKLNGKALVSPPTWHCSLQKNIKGPSKDICFQFDLKSYRLRSVGAQSQSAKTIDDMSASRSREAATVSYAISHMTRQKRQKRQRFMERH